MNAGILNSTIGRAAAAAVAIALVACAIGGAVALNSASQQKLAQKEPVDLLALPKAEDIAPPVPAPESEPEPEIVGDDIEFVEATNRSEAQEQSKQRRCFQNLFPVNVIQKLHDDAFLAYSSFSVGQSFPVLLVYANGRRPAGSGPAMLSPREGLFISGSETLEMQNGFSRKVDVLTIGDKRCASLWSVIERDLSADRAASKLAQEPVPRRSAAQDIDLRKAAAEARAGEAAGTANVTP